MQRSGYFVDAQLIVLLVIGNACPDSISRHKRVKAYGKKDYDVLNKKLAEVKYVFVTPNILTESSNLLCKDARFCAKLQDFIRLPRTKEINVDSKSVVDRKEFTRLGLTDSGLLDIITPKNR